MKQSLKPRADKPSEPGATRVMACLLKNEPASYASVAKVNAGNSGSRRETESEQGVVLAVIARTGGGG